MFIQKLFFFLLKICRDTLTKSLTGLDILVLLKLLVGRRGFGDLSNKFVLYKIWYAMKTPANLFLLYEF